MKLMNVKSALKTFLNLGKVTALSLCLLGTEASAQTVLFNDPPLIQATIKGDYKQVRSMLLQGQDPNMTGPKNATILIIAAQRRYVDIVEMAIEFGSFVAQFDVLGNNALFYAVDNVDYETIEILLNTTIDINHQNSQGETALHWAARVGDLEIIQTLLDFDADPAIPDYTGRTIIDHAKNSRNARLVDDLSAIGIN